MGLDNTNLDWEKRETGWVNVQLNDQEPFTIQVKETNVNSGIFIGKLHLDFPSKSRVRISYGYMGFEKEVKFQLN